MCFLTFLTIGGFNHDLWYLDSLYGFPIHTYHAQCLPVQATLEKRVKQLKALALGCSNREICILAVAVEDLHVNRGVDAMTQLIIIQVDPRIKSNKAVCQYTKP